MLFRSRNYIFAILREKTLKLGILISFKVVSLIVPIVFRNLAYIKILHYRDQRESEHRLRKGILKSSICFHLTSSSPIIDNILTSVKRITDSLHGRLKMAVVAVVIKRPLSKYNVQTNISVCSISVTVMFLSSDLFSG